MGFKVGYYAQGKTLVIDPTLVFSSFSGSLADNWGYTATYDAQGNLYGGGIVFDAGYPTTAGAIDPTYNDVTSAGLRSNGCRLTKFSANGFGPLVLHLHRWRLPRPTPFHDGEQRRRELVMLGTTGSDDFPYSNHRARSPNSRGDLLMALLKVHRIHLTLTMGWTSLF